ncbi:MAG: FAD:protein FMN transferase [Oscillospiraceae bacterium]|nr:FAD:protein FMN transferase [Oscillospiraceae bacterium]
MRRRVFALALAALLLSGCAAQASSEQGLRRYEASFLTLFDTVTTIVGYGSSEEDFRRTAQTFHDGLMEYHQLFDIYHEYDGVNNLKTVNDSAGGGPVEVDRRIIDLLLFCRELEELTGGRVDVTMGSVLALWHEARAQGVDDPDCAALPSGAALEEAAAHTGFHLLEIDEEASTVRLTDPQARLDVGAVAKGYAVEQVCRVSPAGLLVSVGGNVRATGPKPAGDAPWVVGVQEPDGGKQDYLHTLYINRQSVVSSGDYQRYYTVDGVRYHHIIDPETLYPGSLWRAVTVVCADSGLADGLSTALFLLPEEEGAALARRCGAQAMWVAPDGTLSYTDGFLEAVRT